MPSVNAKVRLGSDDDRLRKRLGHADQTGIGEAHRHAGILGAKLEHGCQLVAEIQSQDEVPFSQETIERNGVWLVEQ
jgi:hypothetical protein